VALLSFTCYFWAVQQLRGLSPRANYTDRANAACLLGCNIILLIMYLYAYFQSRDCVKIYESLARGSIVVKVLCYNPEDRGFEILLGE
jgi:hypothetical protein